MGRRLSKAGQQDETKMEVVATLSQLAGQIKTMLTYKGQEQAIDHANDVKAQEVLQLIRTIKRQSTEPRIQAFAEIAEQYLQQQIDMDLQDDEPWKKERDLLVQLGNGMEKAITEARKL